MALRTTKAFDCFLSGLDPEGSVNCLRVLEEEVQRLRAQPPGAARAREVHRRVDAALEGFAAMKPAVIKSVRCGKGCAHCCRLWVGITRDEADVLAEAVREGRAFPDRGRMAVQRGWTSPADFIGKPREEAACAFLGSDGACTVYDDRPSICRAVLVASDPESCRTGGLETRLTAVINPYVEVIVSAALTVDAETDPPPRDGRHLAEALGAKLEE